MKKLFKIIGVVIVISVIIAIISKSPDNKLPYDKIENNISNKQYDNINYMMNKGFKAERSSAQRINVKLNDKDIDGYFIKIKVNGPGLNDYSIIYMGGNENDANPVYCTDPNSQVAFEMLKNKLYYTLQSTDEWKALNTNK